MAALRHGKRGGLKEKETCWAHCTTQSVFRAFSAQVLPGRETGGWELGVGEGGAGGGPAAAPSPSPLAETRRDRRSFPSS